MILKGDCIEVMKAVKPNSVDAIVCDPPYGLEFMGKEWDKLRNTWQAEKGHYHNDTTFIARGDRIRYKAGLEMQLWHTQWLTEAYRVLKPGGSMLVMGGTRTFHRLACAIEDTGFIIKDCLMWLYGSGFPKAQDLGKMIDKRGGRNQETYKPFAKYLKERRMEKHLSMSEIDERLGTNTAYSWWEGRLSGIQLPTMEYYLKLKEILSLDDRFDKLIEREEAEREKIGEDKHWGQAGNSIGIGGQEWDLSLASTDLAKYWDGFKVGGIKPAYEPIIWAVKPPEGSYIDNVLKWGVGAVNVDATRVLTGKRPSDTIDICLRNQKESSVNNVKKFSIQDEQEKLGEHRPFAQENVDTNGLENRVGKKQEDMNRVDIPCSEEMSRENTSINLNMSISGKKKKAKFQKDLKSTISTKTKEIIESKSLNSSKEASIEASIIKANQNLGRFPANVILSHHPECVQVGVKKLRGNARPNQSESIRTIKDGVTYLPSSKRIPCKLGDPDGYEQVESWDCHPDCPIFILDQQSGVLKSGGGNKRNTEPNTFRAVIQHRNDNDIIGANSGGASRFFYCAKASRGERNAGLEGMEEKAVEERHAGWTQEKTWIDRKDGKGKVPVNIKMKPATNNHPTVKPIKLFEWLIKLVTREGQVVLDPFIGSGTTAIAAHNTGRKCIGIEKEGEYLEIAKRRIRYWEDKPRQLEILRR